MVRRFSRRNKRSISKRSKRSKRLSRKNKYLRSKRRIKRNIKKGGAAGGVSTEEVKQYLKLLSDDNLSEHANATTTTKQSRMEILD